MKNELANLLKPVFVLLLFSCSPTSQEVSNQLTRVQAHDLDTGLVLKHMERQIAYAFSRRGELGEPHNLLLEKVELKIKQKAITDNSGQLKFTVLFLGIGGGISRETGRTTTENITFEIADFSQMEKSSNPSTADTFFFDQIRAYKRTVSPLTLFLWKTRSYTIEFVIIKKVDASGSIGNFSFIPVADLGGEAKYKTTDEMVHEVTYYFRKVEVKTGADTCPNCMY